MSSTFRLCKLWVLLIIMSLAVRSCARKASAAPRISLQQHLSSTSSSVRSHRARTTPCFAALRRQEATKSRVVDRTTRLLPFSSAVSGASTTRLQPYHHHQTLPPSSIRRSNRWFTSSTPSQLDATASSSSSAASETNDDDDDDDGFFAKPGVDFGSLGIQSPILLERLQALGLLRPTAVQAAAFAEIAKPTKDDVTIGAETGSGKSFAYLLPLLDDILQRKQQQRQQLQKNAGDKDSETDTSSATTSFDNYEMYDYGRAMILVPNKELVQQVVRMAVQLAGGPKAVVYGGNTLILEDDSFNQQDDDAEDDVEESEMVRIAIMPGGLREPQDFQPFRKSIGLGGDEPPVDLIISTPAAVGPLGLSPSNIQMFADIQTLVIDEADMLLDGGYIRPLENVLLGFRRADRLDKDLGVSKTQHVFVAATLPDFGLRSVDAYLQKKFPYATRVTMAGMHNARHYGLAEQTQWIQLDSKKERMLRLVDMLQTSPSEGGGGLQGEKVMVFLNSVDDVEAASQALARVGVSTLPYHAKMSLGERTANLDRFRRYDPSDRNSSNGDDTIPILVCTDLASRGLDVPMVSAVVQLQFAGNVVAHLHRMGRCGRAGLKTGRGVVFYGSKEQELVDVVREAEEQQERMVLPGDVLEVTPPEDSAGESPRPAAPAGSVQKAFSRKRGFTKKRKKDRRESERNNM